jgi:predicted RNase H-like HicB family nuclease
MTFVVSLALLFTGATGAAVSSTSAPVDRGGPHPTPPEHWPFRGDPIVNRSLTDALIHAAGLEFWDVRDGLKADKSIADIAKEAGKTQADVLKEYDALIDKAIAHAVEDGIFPESMSASRAAWFKAAGRQMIDLPGLQPAYPGLHELHVALLRNAGRIAEIDRREMGDSLKACKTLDEIMKAEGHTGQQAVDAAMENIDTWLADLVESGDLTAAKQTGWSTSIEQAFKSMLTTPGLHVAGKECAH